MRKSSIGTGLFAALALAGSCAFAQWIPVTAKEKTTQQSFDKAGKLIRESTTWGIYYRSSDGSTLEQDLSGENGIPTAGHLLDYGKTKKVYYLNYTSNEAIERRDLVPAAPQGRDSVSQKDILGQGSFENIPYLAVPIYDGHPGGKQTLAGQGWMAADYDQLTLRLDYTYSSGQGTSARYVKQLYDIHIGAEPDAKLMDVGCSFKVLSADSNRQRPVCSQKKK